MLSRRFARARSRALRLALLFLAWLGPCVWLAPARADDLTDFEHARSLYVKRNYSGAAAALKVMVGSDPPRVSERLLIIESRKYLAASLLFLGQRDEARAQFLLLLALEPTYTIDPLAFPTEVVTLFEKVKGELEALRRVASADQERERQERERRAQEQAQKEREALERLFALAQESETRTENSRWIATIPFGVGQFQNGHKSFGMALAVLESLAAATSVVTYIGHEQVADDRPSPQDRDDAGQVESIWRNANNAAFGVFVGLALIGVIDAHARFVPGRISARSRPLPPDLERFRQERKLSARGFTLHF